MSRRNVLVLVAIALVFLATAMAADINGKWTSEFDSQIGRQSYTFEFKAEGSTLTGKITHNQRGTTDVKEGKVDGDEVSFVELASFQGNEVRIEYKGKVSGDEIRFHRKVGEITAYEIVAKRAK